MKLYVYDLDSMEVIAIAEGESEQECEDKVYIYTNDYGTTYSDFGLIENDEAEIL